MARLRLLRHGEHIKAEYQTRSGHASWGRSTDQERPEGGANGIVKRYKKNVKASRGVTALALTKAVYPHAIEYIGLRSHLRGLYLLFAAVTAASAIGGGLHFLLTARNPALVLSAICCGFILVGLYFLLLGIRHELYQPYDEPIIFDRRRRKVYRLFRNSHPGFIGLLLSWPMCAAEYDWDLIDVEHSVKIVNTGNGTRRDHALVFIVRRSKTDSTIIDSFNLSRSIELNETNVPALWEHTRRFMEENGPHLPEGESITVLEQPNTLWHSLGTISPFGPKYFQWWKNSPIYTALFHLISPVALPVFLTWGVFHWLSHTTSHPVIWPVEVCRELTSSEGSQSR